MVLRHAARGLAVLALVLAAALPVSGAPAGTPTTRTQERAPQTVVVQVNGGLRWLDVGLGAATALAVVALVYGLVLAVRPHSSDRARAADR